MKRATFFQLKNLAAGHQSFVGACPSLRSRDGREDRWSTKKKGGSDRLISRLLLLARDSLSSPGSPLTSLWRSAGGKTTLDIEAPQRPNQKPSHFFPRVSRAGRVMEGLSILLHARAALFVCGPEKGGAQNMCLFNNKLNTRPIRPYDSPNPFTKQRPHQNRSLVLLVLLLAPPTLRINMRGGGVAVI